MKNKMTLTEIEREIRDPRPEEWYPALVYDICVEQGLDRDSFLGISFGKDEENIEKLFLTDEAIEINKKDSHKGLSLIVNQNPNFTPLSNPDNDIVLMRENVDIITPKTDYGKRTVQISDDQYIVHCWNSRGY